MTSSLCFSSLLFYNVEYKANNSNLITYLSSIKSLYNHFIQTLKLIFFSSRFLIFALTLFETFSLKISASIIGTVTSPSNTTKGGVKMSDKQV